MQAFQLLIRQTYPFRWILLLALLGPLISLNLTAQVETGIASYYADYFQGRPTALGETYDTKAYTAAHRSHPLGTLLRVTRPDNGRSVVVRVNDRGPQVVGRIIDVSGAAAAALDLYQVGKARVTIETVGHSDRNPIPEGYVTAYPADRVPAGYTTQVVQPRAVGQRDLDFAVQIASYEMAANATRRIDELDRQQFEGVFLRIGMDGRGQKTYQVLIGPFSDRTRAHVYLEGLRRDFRMDGLVVPL